MPTPTNCPQEIKDFAEYVSNHKMVYNLETFGNLSLLFLGEGQFRRVFRVMQKNMWGDILPTKYVFKCDKEPWGFSEEFDTSEPPENDNWKEMDTWENHPKLHNVIAESFYLSENHNVLVMEYVEKEVEFTIWDEAFLHMQIRRILKRDLKFNDCHHLNMRGTHLFPIVTDYGWGFSDYGDLLPD